MSENKKDVPQKSESLTTLKVGEYTFKDLGTTVAAELESTVTKVTKQKQS